jgi:hypothetical protein
MDYLVKHGLSTLDRRMSIAQAKRHGERMMPPDLKRAGFVTLVGVAPTWLTGADEDYIRINYGKVV